MRVAIAAVITILLAACAARPIANVENRPIPEVARALPLEEIEAAITVAATSREWLVDSKGPGKLYATYAKKDWEAVVEVSYSKNDYSIRYVSSRNLIDDKGGIHYNYGRWVHNLDQDIAFFLNQAAMRKK